MSKKKIVKTILKEVLPEVAENVLKKAPETVETVVKKSKSKVDDIVRGSKKVAKKAASTIDDTLKVGKNVVEEAAEKATDEVAEKAFEDVSTKLSKAEIAEAKGLAQEVTQEQAKEASKTALAYSEKGVIEEQTRIAASSKGITNEFEALQRGDLTKQQYINKALQVAEPLTEIKGKRKVYASGPAQILQSRSNDYTVTFLNRNAEKIEGLRVSQPEIYLDTYRNLDFFDEKQMNMLKQYGIMPKETVVISRDEAKKIAEANPELLHDYLSHIDNAEYQKAIKKAIDETKSSGTYSILFKQPSKIAKNIMLLANVKNRGWDLASNFFSYGLSLSDITLATHLSGKARRGLSKVLLPGKYRQLLSMSDSHFSGEASKNLAGMREAVFDFLKTSWENAKSFAKDRNLDNYKETLIGKHNRKVKAQYSFERNKDFSEYIVPDSVASVNEFLKEKNIIKKGKETLEFGIQKAGYYGAAAPDVFGTGAFRNGYTMQEAFAKASELVGNASDDVIKKHGGYENFVNEVMDAMIASDMGNPLTKEQKIMAKDLFGRRGTADFLDHVKSVSELASQEASENVYRTGGTKTVFGKIGTGLDEFLSDPVVHGWKIPLVGKIYDAAFPLVKTTIRTADLALSYNPISSGFQVVKEARKAASALEKGIQPNIRDFDRAIGKFATGSIAYVGAYELFANKFITGKFKQEERKMLTSMGYKEDSICLGGYCLPYKRSGVVGEIMSNVANIFGDIKDIYENYTDPKKLYDPKDIVFDMIGLLSDPLANMPIGRLLSVVDKRSVTPAKSFSKITKGIWNSWTDFFERKIKEFGGEENLLEMLDAEQKKLFEIKRKSKPKLDCFGYPIRDSLKIKNARLEQEMFNNDALCGPFPSNASIDGIEVPLYPMESYYWSQMMRSIYDENTDSFYEARDKMEEYVFGTDTYKGTAYNELDIVARDMSGEAIPMYKTKALKGMYSDERQKAFKTLLKCKDVEFVKRLDPDLFTSDEKKELARAAFSIYNRRMNILEQQMKIKNKPLPVNPAKPTLSIGE